jgi:hypothetical protein
VGEGQAFKGGMKVGNLCKWTGKLENGAIFRRGRENTESFHTDNPQNINSFVLPPFSGKVMGFMCPLAFPLAPTPLAYQTSNTNVFTFDVLSYSIYFIYRLCPVWGMFPVITIPY